MSQPSAWNVRAWALKAGCLGLNRSSVICRPRDRGLTYFSLCQQSIDDTVICCMGSFNDQINVCETFRRTPGLGLLRVPGHYYPHIIESC